MYTVTFHYVMSEVSYSMIDHIQLTPSQLYIHCQFTAFNITKTMNIIIVIS